MLLIRNNINKINKLKNILASSKLELTELGSVNLFLGIEITRNRKEKSIIFKQTKYIEMLLEKFNKTKLIPTSCPSKPSIKYTKNTEQASKLDINYY